MKAKSCTSHKVVQKLDFECKNPFDHAHVRKNSEMTTQIPRSNSYGYFKRTKTDAQVELTKVKRRVMSHNKISFKIKRMNALFKEDQKMKKENVKDEKGKIGKRNPEEFQFLVKKGER